MENQVAFKTKLYTNINSRGSRRSFVRRIGSSLPNWFFPANSQLTLNPIIRNEDKILLIDNKRVNKEPYLNKLNGCCKKYSK